MLSNNTRREVFPTNIIANTFNFAPEPFLVEKPKKRKRQGFVLALLPARVDFLRAPGQARRSTALLVFYFLVAIALLIVSFTWPFRSAHRG